MGHFIIENGKTNCRKWGIYIISQGFSSLFKKTRTLILLKSSKLRLVYKTELKPYCEKYRCGR